MFREDSYCSEISLASAQIGERLAEIHFHQTSTHFKIEESSQSQAQALGGLSKVALPSGRTLQVISLTHDVANLIGMVSVKECD